MTEAAVLSAPALPVPPPPLWRSLWAGLDPRPVLPGDAPLRLALRGVPTLVACAGLAALLALARSPDHVEVAYARVAGPLLARVLSAVSQATPFGLAEPVIVLFFGWLLVPGLPAAWRVARRRRRLVNAAAAGLSRLALGASVAAFVFYAGWGLHYARPPLAQRMGLERLAAAAGPAPTTRAEQVRELAALGASLVDEANRLYRACFGTADLGRPSAPPGGLDALDAAIERTWPRVIRSLGLADADPALALRRGPAKPVRASALLSRVGISGFYFPWTGEACFNRDVPPFQLAHTLAHEKAHQRGIASEDEANFLGALACAFSDDPYLRYAGALFVQRQILTELLALDSGTASELIKRRLPGIQRDINSARAFWTSFQGPARTLGHAVNDAYLKAHGVEGGVRAYAASSRLLILFARSRGGKLRLAVVSR